MFEPRSAQIEVEADWAALADTVRRQRKMQTIRASSSRQAIETNAAARACLRPPSLCLAAKSPHTLEVGPGTEKADGKSAFSVIRLGFEPKTHSLEGCCSIQLSYRTVQRPQM